MKTIIQKLTKTTSWVVILLLVTNFSMAQNEKGLMPSNKDGFETGDWHNFRPHYAGDAEDWIRPNFSINQTDPISGNYSLQWNSDDKEHKWFMLSNAFYLEKPVAISVDFRVTGDAEDFETGLLLMASKDEFAGIKVSQKSAELFKKGNTTIDNSKSEVNIMPGTTYRLLVSITDDEIFKAEIREKETDRELASFESKSFVEPGAVSKYIKTDPNSNTTIDFDNLEVQAADYKVPAGEYVRSPQFVILPRVPDVEQDQGNWVGGHSSMLEGDTFKMWYRIRDNKERGRGYGFAQSNDGLNWEKYENNPLFTHHEDYKSNEKICVLKVDGLYKAWYAVDTPESWYTAYATSQDGLNWEQHGLVIDESYCKDPVIVYVDGTYYLYSIKDENKLGVYTSPNGVDFTHQNTIEVGVHAHVGAFHEKKTGLFHLYSTGGFNGVNHAVSSDGIHFGFFTNVMNPSPVGLDDWETAGVTYLSFISDEFGHIEDADALPFHYQARNDWDNNIPGWKFHGGDKVVLGGKYEGLYVGVPAVIEPDNSSYYEAFPYRVPKADGLSVSALRTVRIIVDSYDLDKEVVAEGSIEVLSKSPRGTQVQIKNEKLIPGKSYQLFLDEGQMGEMIANKYGTIMFTIALQQDGSQSFQIKKK
ncbi:MAG: hypothetical protein ACQEQ0_09985 [Bacteroidota bacterium]